MSDPAALQRADSSRQAARLFFRCPAPSPPSILIILILILILTVALSALHCPWASFFVSFILSLRRTLSSVFFLFQQLLLTPALTTLLWSFPHCRVLPLCSCHAVVLTLFRRPQHSVSASAVTFQYEILQNCPCRPRGRQTDRQTPRYLY